MKILLLGANGQLGRTLALSADLSGLGTVVCATRDGTRFDGGPAEVADLSHPPSLVPLLDRLAPDVIVNAAAYTAVDRAETEEDLATRINGEAPGVLGTWAAHRGALVLHYSTDYVFDGESEQPYKPADATAPLGAYGRSKLAGERALAASGAAHLILRTAWVYAPFGQNFMRTMLRLAAERDELRVVADQIGAPTTTDLIAKGSVRALQHWLAADNAGRRSCEGIQHLVAGGRTSWHGFASAIISRAHALGLIARTPLVSPIPSSAFPTPARRPRFSVLDTQGFEQAFGMTLPSWQEGLDNVLTQLSQQGT